MKSEHSEAEPVVFVIDDDASIREALSSLLRSVGMRVDVFPSAPEFVASSQPDAPCCLILDVRLPGASGLDFQAEVTKEHIKVPIIFITGHADVPMSVKAMKAGAVEFLTKPIREQDLLDAVRMALDRDRARRQHDSDMQELRANYDSLSHREREVMRLVVAGLMNKQAAAEIGISEVTLKVHRHNIMKKLHARSLADLVRMADSLGIPRWKSNH